MKFTLKKARKFAEKTQEQVANHIGINRSTYIKYEAHPEKCPVGIAKAIANYLGVSIDDIFF